MLFARPEKDPQFYAILEPSLGKEWLRFANNIDMSIFNRTVNFFAKAFGKTSQGAHRQTYVHSLIDRRRRNELSDHRGDLSQNLPMSV